MVVVALNLQPSTLHSDGGVLGSAIRMVSGIVYGTGDGLPGILFARFMFFGGFIGGWIFHSSGAFDSVGNDAVVVTSSVVDGSLGRDCGRVRVSMETFARRVVVAGNFDTFHALCMVSATRSDTIPFATTWI